MSRWLALALLAVAAVVVVAIVTGDDDGTVEQPPAAVVVKVDGADSDTARDQALTLSAPAQEILRTNTRKTDGDLAGGLGQGNAPQPPEGPLAAQETPGCRTQFVRNQSSRAGRVPSLIVWHYTVSSDRAGRVDNDALTAMANNPANGVSWHYSIGRRDGECAYNVPLSMKAWTQANANPFSVGIEVIATGREPVYVEGAGKAKLFRVTRYVARRYGIPIRRGRVANCQPVRSGIVQHEDLGQCGGGHVDVTPYAIQPLVDELARLAKAPPAAVVVDCRDLARYRRRQPSAHNRAIIARRVVRVRAAGYRCGPKGKAIRR